MVAHLQPYTHERRPAVGSTVARGDQCPTDATLRHAGQALLYALDTRTTCVARYNNMIWSSRGRTFGRQDGPRRGRRPLGTSGGP